MIAIETRYIPCTNFRPTRIVAETANGQRLVMSASAAEDATGNKGGFSGNEYAQRHVAQKLADKMGWPGYLHCGGTKRGYVFVFDEREDRAAVRRAAASRVSA